MAKHPFTNVKARCMLEKFGKGLETLRIDISSHWEEIASYCPDLRHLYLDRLDCYEADSDAF